MIRVIISNENIYDIKDEFQDEAIFKLISVYKEILQNALSLNNEFNFRTKEAVSLKEILKLIDAFQNLKLLNIENIKSTIKYFKEETRYNNEEDGYKLCKSFDDFCEFLFKKFENSENKRFDMYKTFSFIFFNEYLKITNEKFRILLFQKILEKNELIINSSQLFKLIIENVIDINPSDMENNLELIKEKKLPLFKMLNDSKNEVLDEVLFNIFEEKVISFFDSIPKCSNEDLEDIYPQYIKDNKNNKIRNETGIIFDNSFNIFKQVAEFLDEIKDSEKLINDKNENIHLDKLYSIVYVKYYLYKLVVILKEHKKEIKNITKIKDIFNFIKKLSIGFSRVIKIYIFKFFYYLMNNNY